MAIDVKAAGFKVASVKFEDMVNDAVERHDAVAYLWLKAQRETTVERTGKDGNTITARLNIQTYRVQYLRQFCGYAPKTANKNQVWEDQLMAKAAASFTAAELEAAAKKLAKK